MSFSILLYVVALILALIAILPPMRNYFLLNVAMLCVTIGLLLQSGFVHAG